MFANLKVNEQLHFAHVGLLSSMRRSTGVARNARRSECERLLRLVGLDGRGDLYPSALSYGEQRRVEIARALITQPRLLFLDEPAAGMVPSEQHALADLIGEIAGSGISVLLIEHHMELVGRVADEVVVLNFGRQLTTGSIAEVRANPDVIAAYLGSEGRA